MIELYADLGDGVLRLVETLPADSERGEQVARQAFEADAAARLTLWSEQRDETEPA